MALFDVHAHLTHPRLAEEEAALLARAEAAGVGTIVANGLHPADNEAVLALSRRSPIVRPAFGFYPVDAVLREMEARGVEYPRDGPVYDPDEAVDWVAAHVGDAFAIGEIGLDGYWVPKELWPAQDRIFRRLVEIAMGADLPIIIHTRKREAAAFDLLREMGASRVNWHCFGGRVRLARRIAEAGHFLSIPANAPRHEAFTRMLETLPRERVLLETDCPYLAPERGGVSEPADVRRTATYAARCWGCSLEAVEDQLRANFRQLFREDP